MECVSEKKPSFQNEVFNQIERFLSHALANSSGWIPRDTLKGGLYFVFLIPWKLALCSLYIYIYTLIPKQL